jgi:hypothetical protein
MLRFAQAQPALDVFERDLRKATQYARDSGLPQGLIVAMLQGHSHIELVRMTGGTE